ncbi:NTP transferase domain-containing protein [Candidatus Bipolaricaulota bacterium]|nr:NTP transferase domain-containing protein [Candidatus Bipolaricaulota bacterium]
MKTIILAGGYATRLHPLTATRAKPLLPVIGKPIIDHLLSSYNLPARPIVSTNRRFAAQFAAWQAQSVRNVEIVVEETTAESEKLGTVGALHFLIERLEIDEDILVIGGDNLFKFPLADLLAAYKSRPLIALYDVKDLERVRGRYGVAIVKDGRIVEFQEKPSAPRSTLASTACYIYPKETLPLIGEFLARAETGKDAPGYFNAWLLKEKGEHIDAFVFETGWYDIGDRASYIEANQHYSNADTWLGKDVMIENSTVTDSVLLDGVKVIDSSISGCVIDRGCHLEGITLHDCLIGEGSIIRRG